MIKLYSKIKKRLAKKLMGNDRWKFFKCYANGDLTIGSIVHTCSGYNKVVTDLTEVVTNYVRGGRKLVRGKFVIDIDVDTAPLGSCSLYHCCYFPAMSKADILDYFKRRSQVTSEWDFGDQDNRLIEAVKNGEDPFDENGCVKQEYLV